MAKRDKELEQLKIEICEEICLEVLDKNHITISDYVITVSPMRKYNGLCIAPEKKGNPYQIKISNRLFKDGVSDDVLLATIGHELLHTCPEKVSMTHSKQFMKRAKILSDNGIYADRTYGDYFLNHPDEEYMEICCDCGQKILCPKSACTDEVEIDCPVCDKHINGINGHFHYDDGKPVKIQPYIKSSHTPL